MKKSRAGIKLLMQVTSQQLYMTFQTNTTSDPAILRNIHGVTFDKPLTVVDSTNVTLIAMVDLFGTMRARLKDERSGRRVTERIREAYNIYIKGQLKDVEADPVLDADANVDVTYRYWCLCSALKSE